MKKYIKKFQMKEEEEKKTWKPLFEKANEFRKKHEISGRELLQRLGLPDNIFLQYLYRKDIAPSSKPGTGGNILRQRLENLDTERLVDPMKKILENPFSNRFHDFEGIDEECGILQEEVLKRQSELSEIGIKTIEVGRHGDSKRPLLIIVTLDEHQDGIMLELDKLCFFDKMPRLKCIEIRAGCEYLL